MDITLPYGRGHLTAEIGPAHPVRLLQNQEHFAERPPEEIIREAMTHPFGERLSTLASGKKSAVIIASDHTRPVPSRWILPQLLQELRQGNPQIAVTILIACGCHREMTPHELETKFGAEVLKSVSIVQHDCRREEDFVEIGTLPSGGTLKINQVAAKADLLLAEGFIEPHFFAGFSGGRKSVLPGISARESIFWNHSAGMIANPCARAGVLEHNPIHADMEAAADMAGLAFVCNVILDKEKRLVAAVAGSPQQTHRAGCEISRQMTQVKGKRTPIVITTNGGYPLDQNLYQCVKGMATAAEACTPGGVIILCAACEDGHGGAHFYQALKEAASIPELLDKIQKTPPDQTTADQWQYQILARILKQHSVIMVTRPELEEMVCEMHMEYAPDLESAIEMADRKVGTTGEITVIPDGVSTIFCAE